MKILYILLACLCLVNTTFAQRIQGRWTGILPHIKNDCGLTPFDIGVKVRLKKNITKIKATFLENNFAFDNDLGKFRGEILRNRRGAFNLKQTSSNLFFDCAIETKYKFRNVTMGIAKTVRRIQSFVCEDTECKIIHEGRLRK